MYGKIKAADVPTRGRKSESRFERSPDWKAMKADIDRGLKPNEALQIALTEEEKKQLGISNRRTIARFLQLYLAAKDLPCESFHREQLDHVLVLHAGHAKEPRQTLLNGSLFCASFGRSRQFAIEIPHCTCARECPVWPGWKGLILRQRDRKSMHLPGSIYLRTPGWSGNTLSVAQFA